MQHHSLDVVYLELYGMLNQHTIPHKKTYIDVRLIGAIVNYDGTHPYLAPPDHLKRLSFELQIPQPQKWVKIERVSGGWYHVTFLEYKYTMDDTIPPHCFVETMDEVIQVIRKMLDKCNVASMGEKGRLEYEGVVLQTTNPKEMTYIKIKPDSFYEAEGREKIDIPINEIRKEIQKIINENLTEYEEHYDETEVTQNIKENLLEEYEEKYVEHRRTKKIIQKELHKYLNHITDTSINKIVDEILENIPKTNIKESTTSGMRYFAKKYPLLKHRGNEVYFILEKRLKKEITSEQ